MSAGSILYVQDLRVGFATEGGLLQAVDGVCFDLGAGETLAIVGESGSGKSVAAQTIMGLLVEPARIVAGSISLRGEELIDVRGGCAAKIRGDEIAMVFQDPMTSLNPVLADRRARSSRRCRAHRA